MQTIQKTDRNVSIRDLIEVEDELQRVKEENGIEEKKPLWKGIIDRFFAAKEKRSPVSISKKKYCLAALFGGWLGIHQFMVGDKVKGILYLLLCWTGISFTMSILDIWYAAFLKTDSEKKIMI